MDFTSFTFLATILILVLLSASLVLRSYVLRRRYRRRIQQALADGFFGDAAQFDTIGGYRRPARRLGPKPVVFDTWLHNAAVVDTWTTLSPVAVRCLPLPSPPPSSMISSPQPSSLSSPQARSPLFSQLRIPSPFSLSPRPSFTPSRQGRFSIHSPTRSPPQTGLGSVDSASPANTDAATLAVSVFVAMPDASSPVHCLAPDIKGKDIDTHAQQQVSSTDILNSSACHWEGARRSDDMGLPLLEFGVVQLGTGDWVPRT